MRNLVLLFLRFGHFILFILLEIFCLYLIVNYNRKQQDIWANSANIFWGYSSEKWNDWTNYFSLQDKMDELAFENAKLKEKLINYELRPIVEKDTLQGINIQYELLSAKVAGNSTDGPNNYLTINKGTKDGLQKDMGVISKDGIVGIIKSVREDYAAVNSILHRRTFISAMIKRTGAFGELKWIGTNPQIVNLGSIEKYNTVAVGDTIVTSSYSTHFPAGLMIGIIEETSLAGGSNFHDIKVRLNNDIGSLRYVQVVRNLKQAQQLELEKEAREE